MSDNEKQAELNEEGKLEEDESIELEGEQEEPDEDIHLLLEDARNKADSHWNDLLRTRAELENLKKRHSRDLENAHKFGLEKFIRELLPVWDSLAMGSSAAQDEGVEMEKIREGMDLTLKMMSDAMEKFNLEEINPEGEVFDPELHQAMSMLETSDTEPNTVMNVFQKGYLLNGRLIRPAMVVVAKATSQQKES
ncbi:MAG TPA: nucleotide exchange factor GrpE [Gammaproteobacteria bacterium]|nr:nucleotide exchange factor GrpE [Gammaproteobacteria bacterium]